MSHLHLGGTPRADVHETTGEIYHIFNTKEEKEKEGGDQRGKQEEDKSKERRRQQEKKDQGEEERSLPDPTSKSPCLAHLSAVLVTSLPFSQVNVL